MAGRSLLFSVVLFVNAVLLRYALCRSDPCVGYHQLIDMKRSIQYLASTSAAIPTLCDYGIDEKVWYRFRVLHPSRLHEGCVWRNRCGTDRPVFLLGSHPTEEESDPMDMVVCSYYRGECCGGWNATIKVKFCANKMDDDDDDGENGFFVYNLKRVPRCNMAYCAGDRKFIVCPGGSVFNPNTEECTDKWPKTGQPVFEGPFVVTKRAKISQKEYKDFKFTCRITPESWEPDGMNKDLRFEVVFTVDDSVISSGRQMVITSPTKTVELWSQSLKGQAGKTVSCKARSFWKDVENRKGGYSKAEENYLIAINYGFSKSGPFERSTLTLHESSQELTLYFKPTVLVTCEEMDIEMNNTCKFIVKLDLNSSFNLTVSACVLTFAGLDDEDGDVPNLTIKATPKYENHHRNGTLAFAVIAPTVDVLWSDYKILDIDVNIIDDVQMTLCTSIGDPHFVTFDDRKYDFQGEGVYRLVDFTAPRIFQVHVMHTSDCVSSSTATCNCAVVARENNNAVGIYACYRRNPIPYIILDDPSGPGIVIQLVANTYTMWMPSGSRVKVTVRTDFHILDVYVYVYVGSEYKLKPNTSGLCGNFNGKRNDEDLPLDTGVYFEDRDFQFKIRPGKSLFDWETFEVINCSTPTNSSEPKLCSCEPWRNASDVFRTECTSVDPETTVKPYITKKVRECQKEKLRLTRRSNINQRKTSDDDDDDSETIMIINEEDIPLPRFEDSPSLNATQTWPTPSGVTEARAKRICRRKVESSAVFKVCTDQLTKLSTQDILEYSFNDCVTDYLLSDNEALAVASVVDGFETSCRLVLENAVVRNNNDLSAPPASPLEVALALVVANMCPEQCSGRGTCINGVCVCRKGFAGDDCSVDSGRPPYLTAFRKNELFDWRTSGSTAISIFATNFFRSEKLVCQIFDRKTWTTYTYAASVLSSQELVCKLPSMKRLTEFERNSVQRAAKYRWSISVSNDGGIRYSNYLLVVVYDSKCMVCSSKETCGRKSGTCVIMGRCYLTGEKSPFDPCLTCLPLINEYEWTGDETCVPSTTLEPTTVTDCGSRIAPYCMMAARIAVYICLLIERIRLRQD